MKINISEIKQGKIVIDKAKKVDVIEWIEQPDRIIPEQHISAQIINAQEDPLTGEIIPEQIIPEQIIPQQIIKVKPKPIKTGFVWQYTVSSYLIPCRGEANNLVDIDGRDMLVLEQVYFFPSQNIKTIEIEIGPGAGAAGVVALGQEVVKWLSTTLETARTEWKGREIEISGVQ